MNRTFFAILVGAVVGAMAVVATLPQPETAGPGGGAAVAQAVAQPPSAYQPRRTAPPPTAITPEEQANIRVYEAANRGVVNITTSTVKLDRMMGLPIGGQGAGSGSVLDRDGHVLTNYHVIEDAQRIEVTLANGASYPADLVGADAEYDMAVIKINAPPNELFPIKLGQSSGLRVGQKAYAVGNPFGLEGTLTIGIVSSLNRLVPSRVGDRAMTGMIQTDAAMNPGNSGGPLLNSNAEMIGMNVAIASRIGQNSGVGFAIPVDRVRRFLPDLLEHGKVLRAYHGIVTIAETPKGLQIRKISAGSPAEVAGLQGVRETEVRRQRGPFIYIERQQDFSNADIIIAIDGVEISTVDAFVEAMDRHKPGDVVTVTLLRGGEPRQTKLTLGGA